MDPLEEFDHLLIFNCGNHHFKLICPAKSANHMGWLESLASLIVDAMTERVTAIKCLNIPLRSKKSFLAIGLMLNSSISFTPIIRGPRCGTDAGKQFRDLWGDKSEIRHIDGDLFECVIWDSSKDVTSQIIDYVLLRKFKLADQTDLGLWHQVSSTRLSDLLRSFSPSYASLRFPSRASTLHLIRSLDQLDSVLRSFNKHLPLNIMGVQAISAEFRGTSVFAPIVTVRGTAQRKLKPLMKSSWHDIHHTLRPLYATINIETSSKWPRDDYRAFFHMKRLFLLRIKELLVHIGVPSRIVPSGMLDIFINGIVLRIGFCQPLELSLLRRNCDLNQRRSLKTSSQINQNDSIKEPETIRRWLVFNEWLPAVASQLMAISRSHLHTYPEACRLVKRWLSAHGYPVIQCPDLCTEPYGLDSQLVHLGDADLGASQCRLSEIAAELLVVHAGGFTPAVQTLSYSAGLPDATRENFVSSSPLATFLRFLRLLCVFDWTNDILLVDLNDGFVGKEGQEKAGAAVTTFKVTPRDKLPAMVIATPLDLSGTHWTLQGPSVEGLKRLRTLAMQSHELLRAMLVAGAEFSDLKAVFRPDLSQMDVLIKLRPSVSKTRILEAIDLEVPSWALKKTSPEDEKLKADPKGTVLTKESDPVTLDLPHPGASYWPTGYLCDPVTWILRQIQAKIDKWDLFEYMWDRHSGRWIGLCVKDAPECARLRELKPFTESKLCMAGGFARHRESPTGSMSLTVDIQSALGALHLWAVEMVEWVRIQRPWSFKLPGVEVQGPAAAVFSSVTTGRKNSFENSDNEKKERKVRSYSPVLKIRRRKGGRKDHSEAEK
ncbi:Nucleolar protein 6 [Echinococcus granulosus]|uniref:Nucleolar protein 6 n=2 Tax=Echinococcus granulosus TaxID=6210 RepID=W6VA20_ECHGR|nr:Nucleolar protein 6 [Echinococcus granulosus]EUB63579.1 Nucleolar protein 6 [Echinococcus granulosus]KAH9287056.1 Nucleolar protein 6 [Echinococcus granulosus]